MSEPSREREPAYISISVDPVTHDVVIDHPHMQTDEDGHGFVTLTPPEARSLASQLWQYAGVAQQASDQARLNASVEEYRRRHERPAPA